MIKISALNTDTSSNTDTDDDIQKISKEALEETALNLYNKSLICQRSGKIDEALHLLKEITEDYLTKLENKNELSKTLLNLKYSCYRNIGSLFNQKGITSAALDYYLDAAEIDPTDVVLWNRIGDLAIKNEDFYLAIHAFKQGLLCNPKHWPCLDKLVMLLYAVRENVGCLTYISQALQLDSGYIRGLAIRKILYKYNKSIQSLYEACNPKHVLDPPLDILFDEEEGLKLISESEQIADIVRQQTADSKLPDVPPIIKLIRPLEEYSWFAVGNVLMETYHYIKDNNFSFFSPLELNKIINNHSEDVPVSSEVEQDSEQISENVESNQCIQNEENILIAENQTEETSKSLSPKNVVPNSELKDSLDDVMETNDCDKKDQEMSTDNVESIINDDIIMLVDNNKFIINETIVETTELETEIKSRIQSIENLSTSNIDSSVIQSFSDNVLNELEIHQDFLEKEPCYQDDAKQIYNNENQIPIICNEKDKSDELNDGLLENNLFVINMQEQSFENLDEYNKSNVPSDPDIEELVKITSELEKSEENGELISQELEESEEDIPTEVFVSSVPDIDVDLKNTVVNPAEEIITETKSNTEQVTDIYEEKKSQTGDNMEFETQNDNIESKTNVNIDSDKVTGSKPEVEEEESKNDKSSANESKSVDFEKPKGHALKATNRRRRNSLSMLEIWGWHSKRKSNRSKTNRPTREERNNSIEGVLKRILPSFLIPNGIKLNSQSDQSICSKEESTDQKSVDNSEMNLDCYFGTEKEKADVKYFWEKFAIHFNEEKFALRCDIITLLEYYMPAVAEKWNYMWPQNLIHLYLELYELYRLYIKHPCVLDYQIPSKQVQTDAYVTLLYGELLLNEWLTTNGEGEHLSNKSLPAMSLSQLEFATGRESEWESDFITYMIRVYWLKLLLSINQSKNENAIIILKDALYYLTVNAEIETYRMYLPNCNKNPVITYNILEKLLRSLERYQNLTRIVELYEKLQYDKIVPVLKDTLSEEVIKETDSAPGGADRPMQIAMLLEALWFLDNLQDCVIWAEKCLNEALEQYLKLPSHTEKYNRWKLIVLKCLASIEGCIKENEYFILSEFMEENLPRLVTNLARIVCHQMEKVENSLELPLNTITPWILLHYILQQEEDRGRIKLNVAERKVTNGSEEDEDDDYVPPSVMILFSGHEFLGKYKLCCVNNGELLMFTLDVVMPRLRSPILEPIREKINHHLEQIFFCLYQHPSKKSNKVRHLVDHNVQPQKMCWERAQQLYDFYRPEELPDFDAYRLSSINNETEGLLKRVVHLVPNDQDPQIFVPDMLAFIDGQTDIMPVVKTPLPIKMLGLYYLLADYYLKNNEFPKALKYYTMDVCINPQRLDSWAGMALARASQLETKLNSCDPFGESEFLNKSRAVQSCFKQSVQISPNHLKLWIEFGSFVYSAHSFCSRLLKTEADSLSMERFETLESQKDELLCSALQCFTSADAIWQHQLLNGEQREQDERWLHQYMQGKIAEKQAQEPPIYMGHYMKANELLYENYAEYPLKINYNNPSTLSVEALELHYRIHASVLKYLERHEIQHVGKSTGRSLSRYLRICATGPFATGVSKAEIERRKEDAIVESEKNTEQSRKRLSSDSSSEDKIKRARMNEISADKPITEISKEKQVSDANITNDSDDEKSTENSKASKSPVKENLEDPQEIMDRLMKQCMEEFGTADETKMEVDAKSNDQNQSSNDEHNKPTGVERRGSQESTVTTSTQATSTSSSDSSSSDEASSSSDSSSSDSDSSATTENSKESNSAGKSEWTSAPEMERMMLQCIRSLEHCICRFPQHYKALYRLAHHFFNRPEATRDLTKCRQLLLGQYRCNNGATVQGLFSERKNNNFFNGVWRIPVSEMDRPGSFAAHMSRCMTLLMQVLRASGDHRTLLELCIQLQRIPDADKKYLRDSEREQLSQQALSLCLQCLRELLRALVNGKYISTSTSGTNFIVTDPPPTKPPSTNCDPNPAGIFLLDIYRAYQKAQKHLIQKESLFATLLIDTYKHYMGGKVSSEGNLLEIAVKFCQQCIAANKSFVQQKSETSISGPAPFSQQGTVAQSTQQNIVQRKTSSTKSAPLPGMRPRGRPPNIKSDSVSANRMAKYTIPPSITPMNLPSQSNLGYYPFHPMLLSAAMGSNLDPTTAAISMMMSNYQELMRQYNTSLPLPSVPPVSGSAAKTTNNNFTPIPTQQTSSLYNTEVVNAQGIDTFYPAKDATKNINVTYNKTPLQTKEVTKSKHATSKESILKAVYGKDKSLKNKTDLNVYKKDQAIFKEQHGLSITPLVPNTATSIKIPHISTSPSKTLQQKLAERQKQNPSNSLLKVNQPSIDHLHSSSNPHFITPAQTSFNNPPAAHSHNTYKHISSPKNTAPLPAHSGTTVIKKSQIQPASKSLGISAQVSSANKPKPQNIKTISEIPSIPSTLTITKTLSMQQSIPAMNDSTLSITQIKTANTEKPHTSKLLHFRKPIISGKPSMSPNKNIGGVFSIPLNVEKTVSKVQTQNSEKMKNQDVHAKSVDSVEIITLDD